MESEVKTRTSPVEIFFVIVLIMIFASITFAVTAPHYESNEMWIPVCLTIFVGACTYVFILVGSP